MGVGLTTMRLLSLDKGATHGNDIGRHLHDQFPADQPF